MHEILGHQGLGVVAQSYLDPNSHLGVFLRRCILAFNLSSFECICHLVTSIEVHVKEALFDESPPHFVSPLACYFKNGLKFLEYDDVGVKFNRFDETCDENKASTSIGRSSTFHLQTFKSIYRFVEDIKVATHSKSKHINDVRASQSKSCGLLGFYGYDGGTFLRTNFQIQGYLREYADLIERHGSSFPMNVFESISKRLETCAPELHGVLYLRYLNGLYHDDYLSALENLHGYFDYCAGIEGSDIHLLSPFSNLWIGRYEAALLCLGTLHCHFGHSGQALQALTEAVRASLQNNNDSCLAHTLAAMCDLLSKVGISKTARLMESTFAPRIFAGSGSSLSTQPQLSMVLMRSLKRADALKSTRLTCFNHLALAKFDLKHVRRPLISFGPKVPTKLRTCPASVCKELRFSSFMFSEFESDVASLITDGVFGTHWLRNMQCIGNPEVSLNENARSGNDYDVFHFGAQPNPIPRTFLQLVGASYLVRSSAWEMYGSASLVRLNTLVYATCFADAGSVDDVSLAYVKLIQHLALFKGYKEAFSSLKIAERKFLSISKSRIMLLKVQLLHDHALHKGNLRLAQQLCNEFGILDSFAFGDDMELKTEAILRHARTLLAAKEFNRASEVARSLFCMCYKLNMQVENATVLLLLAEIHKRSGNSVLGMPYALASLSFSRAFNLDLLESSATLMLAELWLSLGSNHAKRALTMVNKCLPMILGHGGLELCARANITVAKCYLLDPSFSVFDDSDMILDPLRQASEYLEILEFHELAAESFYLMAIIFDKLGLLKEREEAATSFKRHIIALENPQDETDPLF